jgi:hypothetical protein
MSCRSLARLAAAFLFGALGMLLGVGSPACAAADAPGPVRTIVVFGDSQAQGVAAALRRFYGHDHGFHVVDKSVAGTSLSQKLQYDWVDTIGHWLDGGHADVAVVMFGGNDRLPVRTEDGGKPLAYRSDAWEQMYTERLNGVLGLLNDAKLPVVWLGQPVAREANYAADMAYLNGLYEVTVPMAGGDFLNLWNVIADPSGNYMAYGKALDGETRRLRLDDGIHFTPAGYDIIVAKVTTEIDTLLAKADAAAPAEMPGPPVEAASSPALQPMPADFVGPIQTDTPPDAVVANSPDHS